MTGRSHLLPAAFILLASIAGSAAQDEQARSPSDIQRNVVASAIHLSNEQERFVWQRINNYSVAPPTSQLLVPVGEVLPQDIPLQTIPDDLAEEVSALKGYDYTIMHDRLFIVNRADRSVAYVIDGTLRRTN